MRNCRFPTIGLMLCMVIMWVFAGCRGMVDREANSTLMDSLGQTSVTVFPAFVRAGKQNSYVPAAAASIAEFLTASNLAIVQISAEQVPITGGWGHNQARMLRESAEAFAAYIGEHPIQTDYALLPEYLTGSTGNVGGIHCYLLDAKGTVAYATLLNSHHKPFTDADPQTTEDCTSVLINVLREDLITSRKRD